ncbi:MAG: VWA domain-containing protein [Gemmatimonadaceae bacterium]|nr:VWA domain-containing protein [Gemmatimonadaceae bacterium]
MRHLLFAIALLLPAAVQAQGWVVPRCGPVPQPRPGIRPAVECLPAQVVRTGSEVKAELRGRVIHFEIEERFVNRGSTLGEADYYFPLPRNAAFQDLKLSIDGEMVAGETMSAEQARSVYEAIVRQQRDPALVEWMGHGLLRLRIFPFTAGEERKVVVRLQAVAVREGDAVRIDYARGTRLGGTDAPVPMPMPMPMPARNARDAEVSRPDVRDRQAPVAFTLSYPAGSEYGRPYSPTHELDVSERGGLRRVSVQGRGGDVTILLPSRRGTTASMTLLAHAPAGEDGFALLTVAPPAMRESRRTPRDFTFVVDVSGSMSGRKLVQAKAAGRQVLGTLRADDRFRIIDFSSDARSFRDAFVAATPANVRAGERYIDGLDAEGGTNISGALEDALRNAPAAGRLGVVLFLTDGAPTAGERNPTRIAERAARIRQGRRVFTFGVGADVNAVLVEQLALEAGGTAHFVRPEESVEHAVSLVASQLVDPVLTDVRITAEGVRLARMHPVQPLDIFAGQDLVVLSRYTGSGRGRIVVQGTSPDGPVRWVQEVNFPARERENAFVARLWATQRVGWLSAEKRKSGSAELDSEIRQLGERFGIPTEFTSYLVLEPGMVVTGVAGGAAGRVAGTVTPRGGRDQSLQGAPPPAATAAAAQFESARRDAALRSARTVDMAMQETSQSGVEMRSAMGRSFRRDADARWTDAQFAAGVPTVQVAPYSEAYFALLRELPALQEALSLGERVLVAGRGVALEVAEGGRSTLSRAELSRVIEGLR